MEDTLDRIKKEADGFRYVYNKINNILIEAYFCGEKIELVRKIDIVNPGITNGCFACELYLKTLLLKQNKNINKTHNLKKLFSLIDYKTQEKIITRFIESEYTRELFEYHLNYIADGFTISRYDYENDKT